jgi:hypothetical protein
MAEAIKKGKKKKFLLYGIIAVIFFAVLYYLYNRGKNQKSRTGVDEIGAGSQPRAEGYPHPQHQTDNEREANRNDGTPKQKISLIEFDQKVMAVMQGIIAGDPTVVWIAQNANQYQNEWWMPQSGMKDDEAIWYTARSFIGSNFYY